MQRVDPRVAVLGVTCPYRRINSKEKVRSVASSVSRAGSRLKHLAGGGPLAEGLGCTAGLERLKELVRFGELLLTEDPNSCALKQSRGDAALGHFASTERAVVDEAGAARRTTFLEDGNANAPELSLLKRKPGP